jgi:hypothetical protein
VFATASQTRVHDSCHAPVFLRLAPERAVRRLSTCAEIRSARRNRFLGSRSSSEAEVLSAAGFPSVHTESCVKVHTICIGNRHAMQA